MAKRKRFRVNKRGIVMLIALLAIISIGRVLVVQQMELSNQSATTQSLAGEIAAAEKDYTRYERELKFAKTDAYIERVAHEDLKYVREGEYIFLENQKDQ